jgi:hypothetical protein
MENRVDDDAIVSHLVEYLKGKPTNRHMPKLIDRDGKDVGMAPDRQQTRLNAA